jgi:hypothetical protein
MGRDWVHAALALPARFVIDLRLGPRTLEVAADLVASVALACGLCGGAAVMAKAARSAARSSPPLPLLLVDGHLPYPSAILRVFGRVLHRRRRRGRGRPKHKRLKPPPGLLVGVVDKVRDAAGRLLRVRTRGLFGGKAAVVARVKELGIGTRINTAHVERLNGTVRGQQARLGRRTRSGSRLGAALQWSLWLWRDLYNWARPHGSLDGRTPAMAMGLAEEVWTVDRYVRHAVHVSDLQREQWAEERKNCLTSALDARNQRKLLPTS